MVDLLSVPDTVSIASFGPLVLHVGASQERGVDGLLKDPPKLFVRWFHEETGMFVEERISFGAALVLAPALYLHMAAYLDQARQRARA